MRQIAATLGLVGLTVLASSCLGSAAPAGSTGRDTGGPSPLATAPSGTRVVVRYVVSQRPCPAPARCRAVRIRGDRPRRWMLVASRTLTCSPDGGDYLHPAAACRALRDLIRLEARGPAIACACPLELSPPPVAVGWVDRRRVRIALGGCAACGLGRSASADMRVLMPA